MLRSAHLIVAHALWKALLPTGGSALDATCGNGHDTLLLAELALQHSNQQLFAMDIQEKALQETQRRIASSKTLTTQQKEQVTYIHGSHASFPDEITSSQFDLIVYNLGYLPGGDKSITTESKATLTSLQAAQGLLTAGGALSILCYPGHAAGKAESQVVEEWCRSVAADVEKWQLARWHLVDAPTKPHLFWLTKLML